MSKRRRSNRRLDAKKKTCLAEEKKQRSQLQQDRLSLGIAGALRDRILQHVDANGEVPESLKQTLQQVHKQISELQAQLSHHKATVADVRFLFVWLSVCVIA